MKYRKTVKTLDRMLYLIGKQRISYKGTQETAANSDTSLAIVWQVTHCYLLLYEHTDSPLRKDDSYISPTNQNELTGIVAKYIQK